MSPPPETMPPEKPVIRLNGHPHPCRSGDTVQDLLQSLGLDQVPVLVEHNTNALFPREFPGTPLSDGDVVEVIRIVAGG